jgi:hypothetical protein
LERKQIDRQRIDLEFGRLRQETLIDKLTRAKDAEVRLVGQEDLDGSTMFIYQYSYEGLQGTGTWTQTRVWVGVGNELPKKIEVESRTSQKGLQFTFKTTTTYFDYDADIVIEAPM